MEFKVTNRFERISPFKARKIVDQIRGKTVNEALFMLKFMPQKTSFLLEKMIRSALANALIAETSVDEDSMRIKQAFVDEGPTMKRYEFRAQGRVNRIRKRTSHITIVLSDGEGK